MHNNPRTRNLNTLLASVLVRLSHLGGQAAEEALATVNAVFLARTFLKYMLDNAAPAEVAAQLDTGVTAVVCLGTVFASFVTHALFLTPYTSGSTPGPAPSGIPGVYAFPCSLARSSVSVRIRRRVYILY